MELKDWKKLDLPDKPGVYYFIKHGLTQNGRRKKADEILYIGKATSLRDRTKSYFSSDLIATRGPLLVDMVFKSETIKYEVTDTVLEALILEASLIKKHQPYYNTKEKDDKSFLCMAITDENVPRVLTVRKKEIDFDRLETKNYKLKNVYGPFTSGSSLKEALNIVRKIFPFYDEKSKNYKEFYRQIELLPSSEKKEEYARNIKNIKLFFEGKKKTILRDLGREMKSLAKKKEFEKANDIKKKIFALNHINDIALLKRENNFPHISASVSHGSTSFRIESYDIAHMSGKNMVGVMTVVTNGEVDKGQYRKFKIRSFARANDPGALREVIERRLAHTEWPLPNLVVVDGNEIQKSVAENILKEKGLNVDVVSVVKDNRHRAREVLGKKGIVEKNKLAILLSNSEAHRFAINYHKKSRNKDFLG